MRTRLLAAVVLLGCAAPHPRPPSGEVVLSFVGAVKNGPFQFGTADLATLPRRSFQASFPAGAGLARFEGVALGPVLADAMELEREADTAVFRGDRGLAVPVPVALLRQLNPVLADRVDGGAVAAWRDGARPLQLAWPNREAPGIDTDPRMRWWWVSGVSEVALQSWIRTYGRALRVPVGAPDEARLGAEAIASSCIGCHRVRGTGGQRGPELTGAVVRGGEPAFAGRVRDHLRQVSGVASAPVTGPATARRIAAFLDAIEVSGPLPEDDLPPPAPELPPERSPGRRSPVGGD